MFQCFNGSLNAYLDKCLEIIALFNDFTVQHVSRDENIVANDLAQQASGFWSNQGKISFLEKLDVPVCQTGQSDFRAMCGATIYSIEPGSAKLDGPVFEIGGSRISGFWTRQVKQRRPILMIGGHPWYII
jgi:hypothetical protein